MKRGWAIQLYQDKTWNKQTNFNNFGPLFSIFQITLRGIRSLLGGIFSIGWLKFGQWGRDSPHLTSRENPVFPPKKCEKF